MSDFFSGAVKAKVLAAALGAFVAQGVYVAAAAGFDVSGDADRIVGVLINFGQGLSAVVGAFAGGYAKTEPVE